MPRSSHLQAAGVSRFAGLLDASGRVSLASNGLRVDLPAPMSLEHVAALGPRFERGAAIHRSASQAITPEDGFRSEHFHE